MKSKFMNEIITKYELNDRSEDAIEAVKATLLSLYYIADVQLVILKAFLRHKTGEFITDEQAKTYALFCKETFLGKYTSFKIDYLDVKDRGRIYQDFRKFKELYNLGLFEKSNIDGIPELIRNMNDFNIEVFANKNYCIRDVQILCELTDNEIEDYIAELLDEMKKLNLSK